MNKVSQEVVDKMAEEYNNKYILDRVKKYHYYIHGKASPLSVLESAITHFRFSMIFLAPGTFDSLPEIYKNPPMKGKGND